MLFRSILLGSGEKNIESDLQQLQQLEGNHFKCVIGYQEALSHALYAGSDFLLMPSRVEPCGLNQLYAMRFGTIPIVRRVGGLKDTVIDMGDKDGYGICFNEASIQDIVYSLGRAIDFFYENPMKLAEIRKYMMQFDFSWDSSASQYLALYQSLK
mgnify:FL=1